MCAELEQKQEGDEEDMCKLLMCVFLKPPFLPSMVDTNGFMQYLRVKGVWMLVTFLVHSPKVTAYLNLL